ncbi:MAG: PAS domain S-box protein, partial [bacterium]|nr:PAS domain S-box protein [bacterium]
MGHIGIIILPFLHFSCILVCAYMSAFVLFRNRRSPLNITFTLLMICFLIWNFSDVFVHNPSISTTRDHALLLLDISSIGWISFASVLLCFALAFSRKQRVFKNKFILSAIILIPVFFIYMQWTKALLGHPEKQPYGWSFSRVSPVLSYMFYAYYVSFTVLSVFIIIGYGRKAIKTSEKKLAKVIVQAIIVSLLGGSFFDVILPVLGIRSVPLIGNIFVLIFTVGVAYSIVQYKFFIITPYTAAENIISTMEEFLILLNSEGLVLSINQAVLDASGFTRKDLEGKHISLLIREKGRENQALENILKGKTLKNMEADLIRKDRMEIPVLFSSSPLRNEEGRIAGTVFVAREIMEIKLYEKELFEQNKQISLLAEATAEFNSSESTDEIYDIITDYSGKMGYELPLIFEIKENTLRIREQALSPEKETRDCLGPLRNLLRDRGIPLDSRDNSIACSYQEAKTVFTKDIQALFRDVPVPLPGKTADALACILKQNSLIILPIRNFGVLCLCSRPETEESKRIQGIRSIIDQASTALDREKA